MKDIILLPLRIIWSILHSVFSAVWFLTKTSWFFVQRYIQLVNEFTDRAGPRWWNPKWYLRLPVRGFLYGFVPVVLLTIPTMAVLVVASVLVVIDQATYPTFPVDKRFVTIAAIKAGKQPKLEDIGATLMSASYLQMERELDSWLGWTPNDVAGLQFFDNRLNRQLGVRHASIELLQVLSIAVSKYGSADEENPLLVKARQGGFAFQPDSWIFPASEGRYRTAIAQIKEYQRNLRRGLKNATINITNKDIESILLVIKRRVLEVPYGRLTARNFTVPWTELDDRVYFAQGAAIVARDALVAMKYAFAKKIADAGATENMDKAIESLEAVIKFNPWWVMRGDGDSMFADHRAKVARYYAEARNRIQEVADAINR